MLRNRDKSSYAPFVKKQTSPVIATILSLICPGLGAAYNGQTSKAIIYFAVFIGLFQLASLSGMALFVLGFMGMWVFAALDAWRTAQLIRSGITPDGAEDIIVQRFSGNPKLWGTVLVGLGALFFFQTFFNVRIFKAVLPVLLIGLGFYLLRDYIFNSRKNRDANNFGNAMPSTQLAKSYGETSFRTGEFDAEIDYENQKRSNNRKTGY